jgi:transposase-like protein
LPQIALHSVWSPPNQARLSEAIVTDRLKSFLAAMKVRGCVDHHKTSRLRDNHRVENSRLPLRRREREMQRFKSQGQAQCFVSTHSAVYNNFNIERHLISRKTMQRFRTSAMEEWLAASAAGA